MTGVTGDRMAMAYLVRRQEKARERLFAAGWKPTMAYAPAQPEYHDLLLALNDANCAVTRRRLR